MSEHTARRLSPQRQRVDAVRRTAFTGFVVFVVLLVAVELLVDGRDPSDIGRAFEVVTAGSAIVASLFVMVSLAVGWVVFPADAYWSPRDNPLPSWGSWARMVTRIARRVFAVAIGLGFLSLVPLYIEAEVDVVPDTGVREHINGTFAAAGLIGLVVAVAAAFVWLAAEMVAGFRAGGPSRLPTGLRRWVRSRR